MSLRAAQRYTREVLCGTLLTELCVGRVALTQSLGSSAGFVRAAVSTMAAVEHRSDPAGAAVAAWQPDRASGTARAGNWPLTATANGGRKRFASVVPMSYTPIAGEPSQVYAVHGAHELFDDPEPYVSA